MYHTFSTPIVYPNFLCNSDGFDMFTYNDLGVVNQYFLIQLFLMMVSIGYDEVSP